MPTRSKLALPAAAAAVAITAGAAAYFAWPRHPAPPPHLAALAPRMTLTPQDDCMRHAWMMFDVTWAAACMDEAQRGDGNGDGSADCTLPDARAASINALLDEAEARCSATPRMVRTGSEAVLTGP